VRAMSVSPSEPRGASAAPLSRPAPGRSKGERAAAGGSPGVEAQPPQEGGGRSLARGIVPRVGQPGDKLGDTVSPCLLNTYFRNKYYVPLSPETLSTRERTVFSPRLWGARNAFGGEKVLSGDGGQTPEIAPKSLACLPFLCPPGPGDDVPSGPAVPPAHAPGSPLTP
jgi:hypothetical protein